MNYLEAYKKLSSSQKRVVDSFNGRMPFIICEISEIYRVDHKVNTSPNKLMSMLFGVFPEVIVKTNVYSLMGDFFQRFSSSNEGHYNISILPNGNIIKTNLFGSRIVFSFDGSDQKNSIDKGSFVVLYYQNKG